ncbi:MAG TPA: sigma-70 family RNA polymerase sigma factor [Verrucomicrobiae bacterium]|nr:sigma-70 family RNA polymerase sigma factor [Verrucomicrobiae bacterium]
MTDTADADLVARSLAGDRDAFSQIVVRYQNLICSLAYGILGNLGESEDAAQETFIVAWKRLRHLREPAKLRAWLCGIVHNRAHDSLRRDRREAAADAEPLEAAQHFAAPGDLPSEAVIGREEQAILWRALHRVPAIYREPLILFYREHNSIERVAAALELTPDAVKQRLSRGRKMLQDEVSSFVEEALRQSSPGETFTSSVMGALPVGPTLALAAASKGAAAKSGGLLAAAPGAFAWLGGAILGVAAQAMIIRVSPSPREKRGKIMWFSAVWFFVLVASASHPALRWLAQRDGWSESSVMLATAVNWWLYAMALATVGIVAFRWVFAVRKEEAQRSGEPIPPPPGSVGRGLFFTLAVYGANIYWLIALACKAQDLISAAAVLAGTVLLIVLHFRRLPGKNRDEALRVHASQVMLTWGLILLTLNVRLDHWLAAMRGVDLAAFRALFPAWIVPGLTVAFLAWVAALLGLTRPAAAKV